MWGVKIQLACMWMGRQQMTPTRIEFQSVRLICLFMPPSIHATWWMVNGSACIVGGVILSADTVILAWCALLHLNLFEGLAPNPDTAIPRLSNLLEYQNHMNHNPHLKQGWWSFYNKVQFDIKTNRPLSWMCRYSVSTCAPSPEHASSFAIQTTPKHEMHAESCCLPW